MTDAQKTAMTESHIEEARTKHGIVDEKMTLDDVANAKDATDAEHKITVGQGVKAYKKAIFWSVVFSLCIVMDGYDVSSRRAVMQEAC